MGSTQRAAGVSTDLHVEYTRLPNGQWPWASEQERVTEIALWFETPTVPGSGHVSPINFFSLLMAK